MKKFAVMIDYKAGFRNTLDVYPLEAANLIQAMNEAEANLSENVYLIKILEKNSKVVRAEGCKKAQYREILVNRGNGWHASDEVHSEGCWLWTCIEYPGHTAYPDFLMDIQVH